MSPDEFRSFGHRLIDWIADCRANLEHRPVIRVYAPQWDNQEVWESLTADSSPVWLTRRSTPMV